MVVCLVRRQLQGLPWRKDDGIRHQDDSLASVHPVHAREGQPRADPKVPEEDLQNTDDLVALQCNARQERQQRGTVIIGNPVHGAFQPNGYGKRRCSWFLLPFTRACLNFTTLTFRALHGNHIAIITPAVYPRLY